MVANRASRTRPRKLARLAQSGSPRRATRLQCGDGRPERPVPMAYRVNNFPPPAATPLERLTRPQLCARIAALRQALDLLAMQAELDGGAVYPCQGAMRVHLIHLENALRARDRAAERREA